MNVITRWYRLHPHPLDPDRRQLAGGLGEGPGRSGGPEGKQGAVHGGRRGNWEKLWGRWEIWDLAMDQYLLYNTILGG